jgi:hypothetical protein
MDDNLSKALIKALDRLGMNNLDPTGVPGTTEAIAMKLGEISNHLERIAEAIEELSTNLEEHDQ